MTDFKLRHHGSVSTLKPLTQEARDWIAERIPDDALWFGSSVVIEARYVDAVMDGVAESGLAVA